MARARSPLFLARASYRKRRLRDAARMLPIFGGLLLCFPLLWPSSAHHVAGHWATVFGIWALLIAVAAALSNGLSDTDAAAQNREIVGEDGP